MREARHVPWLDSNVFVQAQLRDGHRKPCRRLLAALEAGTLEAWVYTYGSARGALRAHAALLVAPRGRKAFVGCLLAALAETRGRAFCTVDAGDILALGARAVTPGEVVP